ncbi:MAG TPA: type IV pilus biogenesis/stability protein PilW [Oxalicibacterium sp.]|jgi:type IV pilus assembly protein PilF|nr:type IV pilus biogenesis/stability protein PilW [Oxalicibacterium sp.]
MKKMRLSAWLIALLIGAGTLAGCASGPGGRAQGDATLDSTNMDRTDAQKRASIRLQLAVGYYRQGQLNVALNEVKQALQADPNLVDGYSMAALIYMDMGDTRAAEENFRRAMSLAPNDPELSNNYGWFLCQNGRAQESIAYFKAAVQSKTYQSPGKALNNAGVCSLILKDEAAAEKYFTEAFRYEPGNPSVNVNLAKIYYARGDFERAHFYLDRVIKDDAVTPEILLFGIKVERKRGDRSAELSLVTQLRRRYPDSAEYASYQRGEF